MVLHGDLGINVHRSGFKWEANESENLHAIASFYVFIEHLPYTDLSSEYVCDLGLKSHSRLINLIARAIYYP